MRRIAYCSIYQSPIGELLITANEQQLLGITFSDGTYPEYENYLTKAMKQELIEYFAGERTEFSFYQFSMRGFQQLVLEVVLTIPYGKVMTYRQVARHLGPQISVEAVAEVLESNPFLILVPCHRVVLKDGKLHSYRGGLAKKRWLLLFEKEHKKGRMEHETCGDKK